MTVIKGKDINELLTLPKLKDFVLRLYITGATPKSMRAVENIKRFCETYLRGRYRLDIVDIYQQPWLAEQDQIIAVPTLVKTKPDKLCRLIGDLSDTDKILRVLGVKVDRNGIE